MNEKLHRKILELQKELEPEGYIIKGVFGSYARGEMNSDSDIDLLIELNDNFLQKYKSSADSLQDCRLIIETIAMLMLLKFYIFTMYAKRCIIHAALSAACRNGPRASGSKPYGRCCYCVE